MILEQAANIAEILGAITIIGGILFGLFQLREFRRQRLGSIAGELMRTFYSPDFGDAVALVRTLPDGISAAEVKRKDPEYAKAAVTLCMTFETMGLLTYKRIAPYQLVQELTGGIIVVMWRKLKVWVVEVRVEQSQPNFAEWFQWLAEQSEKSKINSEPAHLKYSGWNP